VKRVEMYLLGLPVLSMACGYFGLYAAALPLLCAWFFILGHVIATSEMEVKQIVSGWKSKVDE
jgi:hypothetical protein